MAGLMWPPIAIAAGEAGVLAIRVAARADAATLARWDAEPSVIACTTDDANAQQAFAGVVWEASRSPPLAIAAAITSQNSMAAPLARCR